MKIKCLHGFFLFDETTSGQISRFASLYGFNIVPFGKEYTFGALQAAPTYSLQASPYLGVPALSTFEGEPWAVMKENLLVFNFALDLVVPIQTITTSVKILRTANYFISSGLILPGSLTDGGQRVTDYSAWFSSDTGKFKYSEVGFG